ncbi:MAG: glycosyltransferase [Candidatus Bathyarchaeia archaeon]
MGNNCRDLTLNRTARSAIGLAFVMLGSILAWALRSPDLSTLIIAVIGRFPQLLDPSLHSDGVVFLRSQIELLQNFSTQILARNDWVAGEMRPRPVAVGIRLKFLLIAATTDVSVIIPTLNEEKYLAKCLDSLVNQSWRGSFEIIVVDGGSTDRTVHVAEKYADNVFIEPSLRVGAARNLGARNARGGILAFIDADTIANAHWLEAITRGFHEESMAVGLTGPTLPYDGQLYDIITYRLWTIYLQRILLHFEMPHVIGFNCAYRRAPFLQVGGFDEETVMSEDIKLAHKIRRYGKIKFDRHMSALTSARRFRRYGRAYIAGLYIMNGFSTLLLNRSHSDYPPVR